MGKDVTYQDQKARKNPNQAKKKTRPYMLMGFKPGIDLALRLTGLTSGACHRVATPILKVVREVSRLMSLMTGVSDGPRVEGRRVSRDPRESK